MDQIPFFQPYEKLNHWAQRFPHRKALSGQKLGSRKSAEFFSLTWGEVLERVKAYGSHFRSLGLKKGDRVAIQAKNQIAWVLADWAMNSVGIVSVPIYVQSLISEVEYIVKESEVKLLLTDSIHTELSSSLNQISLEDWDIEAARCIGQEFNPDFLPRDEACTIIYTSGTTGDPKGVMHAMQGISSGVQRGIAYLRIHSGDQLLSYLPLSHIAERVLCGFLPAYSGASVAFVESAEKVVRHIPEIKPTVFLAVPRIWDLMALKLKKEIESNPMLQTRLESIPRFMRPWIFGFMVRRKLGFSRTRMFFSGAAKLNRDTAEYLKEFGIRIAELYGLTETMGLSAFNNPKRPVFGSVGKPYPGVSLRLMSDGEICLKSDHHFVGYYKKPAETAQVLREGWFHTGDIGRQDDDGNLYITDRKKDIFKTSNGKYVAPTPIEFQLKKHLGIREVMVIGENRPYCIALASVDETQTSLQELAKHLEGVNSILPAHERIKTLGFMTRPWTVDGGELTPTMKLKRQQILTNYSGIIEDVFSSSKGVLLVETNERINRAHSRVQ